MNAIQILVVEHEQILQMIEVSKAILNNENPAGFDLTDLGNVIDFIQNFADKYHHMKEEDELFMEMNKHGMSLENGPIGVMLNEHNQGRMYIKQALEAIESYKTGNPAAINLIRKNLLSYGELLTNHIHKENNILYPMAQRLLPKEVFDQMTESFEHKNISTVNNEYEDKYLRMAKVMGDRYL